MANIKVLSKENIEKEIEESVNKGLTYLESVLLLCNKYELEPTDIAKNLSDSVLKALEKEAIALNLVKE